MGGMGLRGETGGEMRGEREGEGGKRTSSSLSLLHSSQPPSHLFFILFTATRRFPAHSGRAPPPHCIGERGVLGGRSPCQSQRRTVPKEPSPSILIGVYERCEPVGS